jgi:drug/metabolite transporter (DMT)-like permease
MPFTSLLQLLALAAIWGSSFLFMRICANALGPAVLIEARVGLAALFLFVVAVILKRSKFPLLKHKKHFFISGLLNSALPFLLFAYAAQTLNASTLSILNSTAALWGAAISVVWTKIPLGRSATLGLVMGIIGVVILVGWDAVDLGHEAILPILAGIGAAASYGLATNYTRTAPSVSPFDNAHGSMWAASILVLPLLPFIPIRTEPTTEMLFSVIAIGILCTGIAYLLYFALVAKIGAASTLSVTFLIPAFGIFWGHIILDEAIGWNTLIGTLFVFSGTILVTGMRVTHALNALRRT